MKKPPKLEQTIGLKVYFSKTKEILGKIKVKCEDFIVEEITAPPPDKKILEIEPITELNRAEISEKKPEREYVHATLQKYNWDTMRAAREITKRLRVSKKRIGFAGTKDKRALTTQRISIWNTKIENLNKIRIKDVQIKNPTYSKERINLGDLWGNRFTVTIREIKLDRNELKSRLYAIEKEIKKNNKIPNFFGVQRFGITRPVTHLVGKEILKKNFKDAAMIYVAKYFKEESEIAGQARKNLKKTGDLKTALKEFPKYLSYEISIINHLVQTPTDFIGALRKLPKKLRWLFIHAYQAYIFNLALSTYIKKGDKIPKTLPLIGSESKLDFVSEEILSKEGLKREDFIVNEMPEMSSKGKKRNTFFEVYNFSIMSIEDDELNKGKNKATIRFSLKKGCYATVFLREILKNKYW